MTEQDDSMLRKASRSFMEHAGLPRNMGHLSAPDGAAVGVGKCGDAVEINLKIDGGRINDIKVMPNGCIYTVVCASALSELILGRTLKQALELEPADVAKRLEGLPEDHMHCARLAVNTLGEAIEDYYRRSLTGEKQATAGALGAV